MLKTLPFDLFIYSDFRKFLSDIFEAMRQSDSRHTYRFIAKVFGFKASNYLPLVINGKRNLSWPTIRQIAKALELTADETLFFKNLVFYNQATNIDDQQLYAKELVKSRGFRKTFPLAASQLRYYSHWYYVAIRELVSTNGFQENPEWIQSALSEKVSIPEIRQALYTLEELGLVRRNGTGTLISSDPVVETQENVISREVVSFHREMIRKGAEALEALPAEVRDISAITVSCSASNLEAAREAIQRFRREMLELLEGASQKDAVYQLNLQLFPLAKNPSSN